MNSPTDEVDGLRQTTRFDTVERAIADIAAKPVAAIIRTFQFLITAEACGNNRRCASMFIARLARLGLASDMRGQIKERWPTEWTALLRRGGRVV